jgi:hypothetical protein
MTRVDPLALIGLHQQTCTLCHINELAYITDYLTVHSTIALRRFVQRLPPLPDPKVK